MRNLKRTTALLLLLALCLSMTVVSVTATNDTGFSDVPADTWYAAGVAYCQETGLMSGVGTDTFDPNGSMTRAMLVTVLHRAAGTPAAGSEARFQDVVSGSWYADAVSWATREGIVSGYGNGRFGTNDPVTREQLAAILWRLAGSPTVEMAERFADEDSIAGYAVDAVNWARSNGIINGLDGNRFSPRETATRAQVAVILMNRMKTENPPVSNGTGTSSGGTTSGGQTPTPVPSPAPNPNEEETAKLEVVVGGTVYTATLAGTQAAQEFVQMLPMTITMNDYGGFEKVGSLGRNLTASNTQLTTTAGDIVLYNGNNIVLFYGSNSWSYTRLGRIDDPTGLADSLGSGSVTVTFRPVNSQPPQTSHSKTLVAYFSATNNTEGVAQKIVNVLGTDTADSFEIVPAVAYTAADLNYNTDCRANREQNDANARPAIADDCKVENMEEYDVIFLGYPIWWGQAPKIVYTFLESYDLSGKTIVPFCTSGSSGVGSSATNLHQLAQGATWLNGQRFAGSASQETVENWVKGLNLTLAE